MGKIFYIMGKSASGKDTVYKKILEDKPELKTVVIYTTRPMRDGETNGMEYYFTTEEKFHEYEGMGKVIESRTYDTVYGPWIYFTADDGQFDLNHGDCLMIGTLESYGRLRDYFGREKVIPVYIYVDDGVRLLRALQREMTQKEPRYAEMCRRFLADEEDFKKENLDKYEITEQYENSDFNKCIKKIEKLMEKNDSIHD